MLTNWYISGFKSFSEEISINLKPLCLISGTNSAGKSSILHSILMICQSVGDQSLDYGPRINGSLVKLGNFSSILNKSVELREFSLGWRIDEVAKWPYYYFGIDAIEVNLSFADSAYGMYPEIDSYNAIAFGRNNKEKYSVSIKRNRPDEVLKLMKVYGISHDDNFADALNYSISESGRALDDQSGMERIGVRFKGISPSEFIYRIDLSRLAVNSMRKVLDAQFDYEIISLSDRFIRNGIPEGAARIIYESLDKELKDLIFKKRVSEAIESGQEFNFSFSDLIFRVRRMRKDKIEKFRKQVKPKTESILRVIASNLKSNYLNVAMGAGEYIDYISRINRRMFGELVTHIGPLRDEPQPFSPISTARNISDVGQRGENSAMVLHNNANKDITTYIINNDKYQKSTMKLRDLVKFWVSYLEIADDIDVKDEGQLGYSIIVKKNGMSNSITHVGVGVSQIIPILTSLLVSRESSLSLIEQPELHLHPATQSRFSDFIICMALSGRQLIVETHSEYMINRLRRRIVEEIDSSRIIDLTQILFINNFNQNSSVEEVIINEYGSVINWPEGFFDQSDDDNSRISKAKIEKLRLNRVNSSG